MAFGVCPSPQCWSLLCPVQGCETMSCCSPEVGVGMGGTPVWYGAYPGSSLGLGLGPGHQATKRTPRGTQVPLEMRGLSLCPVVFCCSHVAQHHAGPSASLPSMLTHLQACSSHPYHFGGDKEVRTGRLSSLPCSPAVLLPAARRCASHHLPPCLEAFTSGWRIRVKMHGLGTAANTKWNWADACSKAG